MRRNSPVFQFVFCSGTLPRLSRLLISCSTALAICCLPLAGQSFIDEVRVRVLEPSGASVKPLEEAILEVQAYGRLRSSDGRESQGRLPLDGAFLAFAEKHSGWLSKAFQCPNFSSSDYLRERRGGWRDVLGTAQNFALKSCYVYTAPPQPGRYLVQASIDGMAGDLRIEVSANAASTRNPESYHFPAEPTSSDPYFPLAEHYAPFIAQETWFHPMADAITRFDYDGDFRGDNNWGNLGSGSTQAYVYYAVVETETHWFLHYNFFHPRDYSDICAMGTCHENDNEGLILAVRKDGSRFGKAEVMQTLAHDVLFTYSAETAIGNGAHEVNGPLVFHDGSHPMVFIEAGGHGVIGVTDRTYSLYEYQVMDWLPGTTGITYVYKGIAERPYHAGATNVGYALLPIYEHWWLRSDIGNRNESAFADFFTYQPYGDRPIPPNSLIAGAFLGIRESVNKAKPFWGWHDDRTLKAGILARGQWGLDPAYGFSRNLHFPPELPISLTYVFNPYLGVGTVSGAQAAQTTAIAGSVAWNPPDRPWPPAAQPGIAPVPQLRPATTAPETQPASNDRPSLSGFGEFARPDDSQSDERQSDEGWSQQSNSTQQHEAGDGVSGWDPAPGSPQPDAEGASKPKEEGPPGWGPTPQLGPLDGEPQASTSPSNAPRGWETPANRPKN